MSILLTLTPLVSAASTDSVLKGTTNDVDYVYTDSDDNIVSRTDQAASADSDPLQVFGDLGSTDQYLYMGMSNLKYDQVVFKVVSGAKYDETRPMDWEYYDGSSWENLDVTDNVNVFADTGLETLKFEVPSDWNRGSWNGKSAYWIRVSPESTVRKAAWVDQIGVVAFNVKVTVEDSDGDKVKNLSESDFDVSNGSDDNIYEFVNLGSGVYEFALQGESSDRNYTMTISDPDYDDKSFSVGTVGSSMLSYSVTLDGDYNGGTVYPSSDCETPFRDISGNWARSEIEDLYCRGVVEGETYYYFEPDYNITRAEFLKIALLNADEDVDSYNDYNEYYDDVDSNDWFYDYVVAGRALGVVGNDEEFRPNDSINRAEAITMLVRLAGVDTNGSYVPFSDVSSTAWYAQYVRAAYYDGVVEGYTDGTFKPSNNLTRGEAAVMASNAYEFWY